MKRFLVAGLLAVVCILAVCGAVFAKEGSTATAAKLAKQLEAPVTVEYGVTDSITGKGVVLAQGEVGSYETIPVATPLLIAHKPII